MAQSSPERSPPSVSAKLLPVTGHFGLWIIGWLQVRSAGTLEEASFKSACWLWGLGQDLILFTLLFYVWAGVTPSWRACKTDGKIHIYVCVWCSSHDKSLVRGSCHYSCPLLLRFHNWVTRALSKLLEHIQNPPFLYSECIMFCEVLNSPGSQLLWKTSPSLEENTVPHIEMPPRHQPFSRLSISSWLVFLGVCGNTSSEEKNSTANSGVCSTDSLSNGHQGSLSSHTQDRERNIEELEMAQTQSVMPGLSPQLSALPLKVIILLLHSRARSKENRLWSPAA